MPVKESNHFLVVLLVIFLALFVLLFSRFLAPLILGLFLAGLSYPFYKKFLAAFNDKKNLAALLTVFLITLIIVLPFLGILTLLAKEAFDLFSAAKEQFTLAEPLDSFLRKATGVFGVDASVWLKNQVRPTLENIGLIVSKEIGGWLSNAANLLINFFIMILTIFYLLRDGQTLGKFLIDFSPLKTHDELSLYKTFKETSQAVFYGDFIAALVQGILGGLGFWVFGLSSPVLWGTVIAFFGLIPFLGAYIVFIPAAVYLFIIDKPLLALFFLLYNILIVSTIDNLIKPKLISDKIKIHPMFILIAILGGLKVFGLLGIIYGPLVVAVFLALLKVYRQTLEPGHPVRQA